ncbi:MAG: phosphoketolase family protein [Bifidobacteriaceae bacterium]|jgi:xylulose-5-phosphate/fructose-6-phosphate phosphoketolase|nr:phosphoketolase family protein [Bifidobacteriaceae bacterium]
MLENSVAWQKRTSEQISDETLAHIEAYWRCANYLSVGQIYLLSNPLMRGNFNRDNVKHRLVGHWGTTPGLNFLYAHISRMIADRKQNTIYIIGPGHGGPALVAASYIEGTYTDSYPEISRDAKGLAHLFKQFSFPGGIPSHVAPETPGSIHEGGELGYSLSHAYGAVMDNPDLLVACIIGDGEAETGPLATAWHGNKFINPKNDGVVLPILHLNGYKIANPTILARLPHEELKTFMIGHGYKPYFFEGGFDDESHISIHKRFANLLDDVMDEITDVKARANNGDEARPMWPMIVFKTPKGWTCPKEIDGQQTEGSWRSHQVPLASARDTEDHFNVLKKWLESYKPEEIFDEAGEIRSFVTDFLPEGDLRMSANPHANGGLLSKDLVIPNVKDFAVPLEDRGGSIREATKVLGDFVAKIIDLNADNFRIFGPDETASNRLQAAFEYTNKVWDAEYISPRVDNHIAKDGQVVEQLSEHQCQGWLEGYNLTGRWGLFNSYEAFIHIIDSMFNQHSKWIKVSREIPWRQPIPALNYLLSSHVLRQDHNGFSHQDPGFIDHVLNKQYEDMIQVYLPADGNILLATWDYILRTKDRINVVVAGKQPAPTFLNIDEAIEHFNRGVSIWEWASTCQKTEEPDVVIACAGDVPTLECLATVDLFKKYVPELKIRFVNVVNLLKIQGVRENPDGMTDAEFDAIFTPDKPIVFAYHGYPWLIHRLTYRRTGHANIHARGFIEKGTTTTPFDMVLLNNLDRYHLATTVLDHVPTISAAHLELREILNKKRSEAKKYTRTGDDMPEVRDWVWPDARKEGSQEFDATVQTAGDNE